ncbi:hypothetical protein Pmar_PMAR022158 [Perkinsus marinus ATCC 50983]|uniref:Uncharacterized protein n=1 Tax=Perkinsus marinus (strain ATCC 50983 / TXsc) TaxID=423536 RepID=C5M091_PERM5|nr:hypothetical protein Pmar_PMAR022158 [Perkinsus marinus ATCC 50983]EEQ97600.1 hypothetical protein Pmar_PMAR022158 [Perkinsus marinus ATCC 50983]|eukprot:XP_002764883.1 hypothetical protein Pmar_PMAR022158 [Perkinsus marinus ATCC 50983]
MMPVVDKQAENRTLKQSNEELEGRIPQLNESIIKARIDKTAGEWWSVVANKAGNPTADTLSPKELIAALKPTGDVLDSVKKCGALTSADVLGFLHACGEESTIGLTQIWTDSMKEGQQPVGDEEDVKAWWNALFQWRAEIQQQQQQEA